VHTRPQIDLSEEVFAETPEASTAEEPETPYEVPGEPDAEEQAPTAEADATGAGLAEAADEEQAGQDPHATDAAEPEASSDTD
jgi:hypothetical protein